MVFKIVHWNIRGTRANSAWLHHSLFSSADVVALQETFLHPLIDCHIPGKTTFRLDRSSRRGGGLITAVHKAWPSRRLDLPFFSPHNEALGVEIILADNFCLQVINIYSPPGMMDSQWLDRILGCCRPPFVIVGDFNSIHSCWGGNHDSPQGKIVLDWILHNNMCVVNSRTPTRISARGSSLLDLSITSPDLFIDTNYYVHPDSFDSDHCPVLLKLNIGTTNPTQYTIRHRYDWGTASVYLNAALRNGNFSSYDSFLAACRDSLNAGKRKIRIQHRTGAPWWDSRCSYLLGQKRKYLRKARRLLCPILWARYKFFAALLRREINDAKRTYWAATCKAASSSGAIYKIIRALQNQKNAPPTSYNFISIPRSPSSRASDEANAFARYYNRHQVDGYIPIDFSGNVDWNIRAPFRLFELKSALANSSNRTPGKDGIPLRALQCLDDCGLQRLLKVFNDIWYTGAFPRSWRESVIVPIPKPGKDCQTPASYRPISLTSVPSKVFERILLQRINSWILAHNLFHPNHFGFLPFRDCTPALTKLYDDLSSARRQKFVSILVSFDISSAYDTVWPDGLALKMMTAGIDGKFTKWTHNSMHRIFQVRWRGVLSDPVELNVGVPQGAVLSPVAFSCYMRDIFEAIGSGVEGLVYADDTFVYSSGPSIDGVLSRIQDTIHNISRWCDYWKLQLNPGKCAAIVFSGRRIIPDSNLRINGKDIPWVDNMRILGLKFNYNLKWNNHISQIKEKALRKLNVLKSIAHVSRGITTKELLRISKATVLSMLHHGSPIYSQACRTAREKLEPIANAALRIATGLPRWTPILVLRRETNSISVKSTQNLQSCCFLIRHLALGSLSPISSRIHPDQSSNSVFAAQLHQCLTRIKVNEKDILSWVSPRPPTNDNILIHTDSLDFQNRKLQPDLIRQLFSAFMSSRGDRHVMATDASKSRAQTCIAFWDLSRNCGRSSKINEINSIFTAEALAIGLALEFSPQAGKLIILSDSKSVLTCLKVINHKSPKVVLHIFRKLVTIATQLLEIEMIWVPGHMGIYGNELADKLARTHSSRIDPVNWISPEDICSRLRRVYTEEETAAWLAGKYCTEFPHLTRNSWEHRKLRLSRRGEVLLTRLRTKSLPTRALLHRFNLCDSPLCATCLVPETCEHYLLVCKRFSMERQLLFQKLGVNSSSFTLSDLCDLAVSGTSQARSLVSFLLRTNRF